MSIIIICSNVLILIEVLLGNKVYILCLDYSNFTWLELFKVIATEISSKFSGTLTVWIAWFVIFLPGLQSWIVQHSRQETWGRSHNSEAGRDSLLVSFETQHAQASSFTSLSFPLKFNFFFLTVQFPLSVPQNQVCFASQPLRLAHLSEFAFL